MRTRPRVSVVIPCLNEAENIEECVRRAHAGARGSGPRRRGDRRRQRLRRTAAPRSPARPARPCRRGAAPRLRPGLPDRVRRGRRRLHRDDRRRPDLRLRGDPALRRRARRRRRARDGQPDGATSSPARCRRSSRDRQPDPDRLPEPRAPLAGRDAHCGLRALRRDALPRSTSARPGWSSRPRW